MEENIKPVFVIDASFVLAFLLRDGNCQQTDIIFKKYRDNKLSLFAPGLLYYEVINGLRSACLSKRIDQKQSNELLTLFLSLDIKTPVVNWDETLLESFAKKVSCYDASYLVLAQNLDAKLLTFDKQLMKEASSVVENYPVFPMSQTLERRTMDALKLHEKGKSKK